jgi:dihydrofolate reductase
MAELSLTAFLSLDGVMQGPGTPDEDRSGGFSHGGWVFPLADEELRLAIDAIFEKADAFLLGRRTWEIFAAWWPKITDPADIVASRLNRLPKYVASRTRTAFDWAESIALHEVRDEVPKLKSRFSREIQIHGSGELSQSLMEAALIDEYRILTLPLLLGSGKRLFGRGVLPSSLSLISSHTTAKGVVISVYRPAGSLVTGSF